MTVHDVECIAKDQIDGYVIEAAKAAGYEKGFGVEGCDLSKPIWWTAYCRQSLDQQAQNNRLPEYLLTMAKMARDQGIVVPREYVFYDHETGEHLDRPAMLFLRHELAEKQKIVGILFADLRCLSREPAPQQVFERECEILGIRLLFGDAPSGMDVGSQFARSALTFSNKLARLATNRNAVAGNIGRVLKGWVPSHKAAYGYVYRRDAEIAHDGKIHIKKAWWELNGTGPDGKPVSGSPADTIVKIFHWVGNEGRTVYWVAKKLNEMGIKGPSGGIWAQDSVRYVMLNHGYIGRHQYNANARVPNPRRPLGDITGAVRRTLIRPKPAGEAVEFSIPPLVTEELWLRANKTVRERGRGRGKEGKVITALLRNRIFCPRCGKPLVLKRSRYIEKFYYLCSRLNHASQVEHCTYRRFIPHTWDTTVWDCVYAILRQDDWVQEQLSVVEKQNHDIDKLAKLEQQKIFRSQTKMAKVREGFEGGLYSLEEAKSKVNDHRDTIDKAEQEIKRLSGLMEDGKPAVNIEELRKQLEGLAQENLDKATFTEKRDIINKLGIRVYPSEDLKAMKVRCSLDFRNDGNSQPSEGCAIIQIASPRSQ
ncbi:MAG: recombinase family protein [Chloroflexota bacterium]|nr:recombinase family protein [Chloroflexota bacterium]